MGSVLLVLFAVVLAWAIGDAVRETKALRVRERGPERASTVPSLVAEGDAALAPEEIARVDALAMMLGVMRQDAIRLCLGAGRAANDAP